MSEECEHDWVPIDVSKDEGGLIEYVIRVCKKCYGHQRVPSSWVR